MNAYQYKIRLIQLTGTSGTLTTEQLNLLRADNNNYIICDNELYYLNDTMTSQGYLVYTHTGADASNNINIKTLAILPSNNTWSIQTAQIQRKPIVLYDKDSSDPNINSGKTSGIQIGESITRELSGYKTLKVYIRRYYVSGIAECDISSGDSDFSYVGLEVNLAHTIYATVQVINSQILFKSGGTQYINRDSYSKVDIETASTNFIIYRIEAF